MPIRKFRIFRQNMPEKFVGRTKPWGTGQAILCCKDVVSEPFLVINADDYYGKSAFKEAYSYLTSIPSADKIQIVWLDLY